MHGAVQASLAHCTLHGGLLPPQIHHCWASGPRPSWMRSALLSTEANGSSLVCLYESKAKQRQSDSVPGTNEAEGQDDSCFNENPFARAQCVSHDVRCTVTGKEREGPVFGLRSRQPRV